MIICKYCLRPLARPTNDVPYWTDSDIYLPGLCQHNPNSRYHEPLIQGEVNDDLLSSIETSPGYTDLEKMLAHHIRKTIAKIGALRQQVSHCEREKACIASGAQKLRQRLARKEEAQP